MSLSSSSRTSPPSLISIRASLPSTGGAPDWTSASSRRQRLRFCELPVVVASSPATAREIMRTPDATVMSRPIGLQLVFQGSPSVIFAPYGEGW